jgi:hypothetical protein
MLTSAFADGARVAPTHHERSLTTLLLTKREELRPCIAANDRRFERKNRLPGGSVRGSTGIRGGKRSL